MRKFFAMMEPSWHTLPKFLNHHGVTVTQFERLLLRDKPALIAWLLLFEVTHKFHFDKVALKASIRRNKRLPAPLQVLKFSQLANLTTNQVMDKLGKHAQQLVTNHRLHTWNGQVVSEIIGTFGYDPGDNFGEIEMHSVLECPECSAQELIRDETHDRALEFAKQFDHVLGTAARCRQCSQMVRPIWREATELDEVPPVDELDDQFAEMGEHVFETIAFELSRLRGTGAKIPEPANFLISARNVDWQGRSGWKLVEYSPEGVCEAFHVNSDFYVSGGEICSIPGVLCATASVAHHDATGSYTIEPVWKCELLEGESDADVITLAQLPMARAVAKAATSLFAGPKCSPFTSNATFDLVSPAGLMEALEDLEEGMSLADQTDSPVEVAEFISELWRSAREHLRDGFKQKEPFIDHAAVNQMAACLKGLESLEE